MRNAVLPSSPSEIIVFPALNLTVCIDLPSKTADSLSTVVGGMIGAQPSLHYIAVPNARTRGQSSTKNSGEAETWAVAMAVPPASFWNNPRRFASNLLEKIRLFPHPTAANPCRPRAGGRRNPPGPKSQYLQYS